MAMMSVTFEVMFRVEAEAEHDEVVCVVGDCEKLGNWNPHKAIVLSRESSPCMRRKLEDSISENKSEEKKEYCDVWKKKVKLCGMRDYSYRYFICKVKESDSEDSERYVKVVRWETNIKPRVFSPADYMTDPNKYDAGITQFGSYGNQHHLTEGWLTDQADIHIRLYDNPIHMWKPKYRKQTYQIKCTPLDQRYKDHLDEDEAESEWGTHTSPPSTFTKVLVSVSTVKPDTTKVLDKDKKIHESQSQHGELFTQGCFMIFHTETIEPESLGFQFDFYVHEKDKVPKHVGYCYLLPLDLKNSNGIKTVPITGLNHKLIGQFKLDYLVVKPVPGLDMKMDVSYQNYWKFERGSIDVGHRGMGSSYKHKKLEAIRENTIQSLQDAGKHGADYVEFDVQLSKDMIAVIYHDFHVAITYRKKKREELEFFEASVKDLTLAELQSMKLSHTSRISDTNRDDLHEDDLDPMDLQPFPTLQRAFEAVEPSVGFNVEVKYPMEYVNGVVEESNFCDRNKYIDIILRCVFASAKKRRVVFSSFDPDVCILLQRKQNKYPVLFLTNGETDFYVHYTDVRTKSINMAICFASFSKILGIDVFSKTLLEHLDMIEEVKKEGLVLFCWGEDNNDSNTINTLKQKGIDGIIYDRIDFYKSGKKNIFQIEREQKERILKQAGVLSPKSHLEHDITSGSELESDTNS